MILRPYDPERDLPAVVALFGAAIHGLAASHYDEAQRAAWAPSSPDLPEWQERLRAQRTQLAIVDGALAGFIAWSDDGHIDLLYTSPRRARSGVASALYRFVEVALVEAGVALIVTEASLVATPFFARQGFRVTERQVVERRRIAFHRNRMEKALGPSDSAVGPS